MEPYIEFTGALQICGFGLVEVRPYIHISSSIPVIPIPGLKPTLVYSQ